MYRVRAFGTEVTPQDHSPSTNEMEYPGLQNNNMGPLPLLEIRLQRSQKLLWIFYLLIALPAVLAQKPEPKHWINGTAESRINTECKTCPYTLCTNKLYYASDRCRTHGTEMDGDKCAYGERTQELG